MKKTFKILAIALMLCAVFAGGAFASEFDHCADALNELGLFKGTDKGYELDRELTRAEAAVMLVRLLGAEKEALSLTYTAPYTDLYDWVKPYVQYLYDRGLTKGTSGTTFGYSEKCTAQQYATFLLRALGYSDAENGDFEYSEAMDFAMEKGIIYYPDYKFLRDNVVAMSYTALATPTKAGDADLLSKLVASGAVSDAKGYDELFANYRGMCEVMYDNEDILNMSADCVIKTKYDSSYEMTYTLKTVYNIDKADKNKSKVSYSGTVKVKTFGKDSIETEQKLNAYYADGVLYSEENGEKIKSEMSYYEALDKIENVAPATGRDPVWIFKDIDVKTAEDGTVTYSVLGFVREGETLTGEISAKDGKLVGNSAYAAVKGFSAEYTMTNIKTGEDVKATAPENLESYK